MMAAVNISACTRWHHTFIYHVQTNRF